MQRNLKFFMSALLVASVCTSQASADLITSGDGAFQVGIATPATSFGGHGNLYDFSAGVGFLRVSDSYDPIAPGTPREAWGISASGVSAFSDPSNFGVTNVTPVSSVFGANSASLLSAMTSGELAIRQNYSFAANNVLQIATTITNTSGSSQHVLFSRNVDWDISPTAFDEAIYVSPYGPPIVNASYYGFENPDPTVAFAFPVGSVGGGPFGPGDLGGGLLADLGILAPGASVSFNVYEGISRIGESRPDLASEMAGLGATTILITGVNSGDADVNSAALGFGPAAAVPEPASISMLVVGIAGIAGCAWRRRTANAA